MDRKFFNDKHEVIIRGKSNEVLPTGVEVKQGEIIGNIHQNTELLKQTK